LDDKETCEITLPTGETIIPHPDFRVIATMNGMPEDLPMALRDRFVVQININAVHPDAVLSLPDDLHAAAQNTALINDPERRQSIRSWKALASLRDKVGLATAAEVVFPKNHREIVSALAIAGAK
jgi:MoxR-like ATPase